MSQGKHSLLQNRLVTAINQVGETQKLAYAFTELRCTFAGRSIVPNIVVFEWQNIPLDKGGKVANKFEIAPDWIIEILSPERSVDRVIRKIRFSLQNGTKLGYLIDYESELIAVFSSPYNLPKVKEKQDIVPVLDILQSWELKAEDIFDLLKFNRS